MDAAAFAVCTSPHTTPQLSDGAHSFEVRAIDAAGNADPTPATRSFTVDTAAPDTTITSQTSTKDNKTTTFAFSSTEAGSSFQCRVDAAAFASCTSPYTTSALPAGPHTFEVRSIDAAGNTDLTPAKASFKVSASKSKK